jgi:hypothetical protein
MSGLPDIGSVVRKSAVADLRRLADFVGSHLRVTVMVWSS